MNERGEVLEIRRLTSDLVPAAMALLQGVAFAPEGRFFTPHSFDAASVGRLASEPGKDLYYLLLAGPRALAYGLLRGWNEGYAVPSLGLVVALEARGQGLGRMMMEFLHAAARQKGATEIRLRVHAENVKAMTLYRRLGYTFEDARDPSTDLLVGRRNLSARENPA